MTQTNQNKDYSWLSELWREYRHYHNDGINDDCSCFDDEEAQKLLDAIQSKIDEHYIGKGEHWERELSEFSRGGRIWLESALSHAALADDLETGQTLEGVIRSMIAEFDSQGITGEPGDTPKLYTEQEVEQRCIEAYKQGRIDEAKVCEQAKRHQLSTNNKDTLERRGHA